MAKRKCETNANLNFQQINNQSYAEISRTTNSEIQFNKQKSKRSATSQKNPNSNIKLPAGTHPLAQHLV